MGLALPTHTLLPPRPPLNVSFHPWPSLSLLLEGAPLTGLHRQLRSQCLGQPSPELHLQAGSTVAGGQRWEDRLAASQPVSPPTPSILGPAGERHSDPFTNSPCILGVSPHSLPGAVTLLPEAISQPLPAMPNSLQPVFQFIFHPHHGQVGLSKPN